MTQKNKNKKHSKSYIYALASVTAAFSGRAMEMRNEY